MNRARTAAWWIAPSLFCLLLYWRGFTAWFRADDFDWLGLALRVHGLRDLLAALVTPYSFGTIRPWSERVFFMAGFTLFGMNPLPFRVVIFATQFVNLALMAAIARRLTGNAAAGFLAAIFWVINSVLVLPLGWVCAYNQAMCAFFLLLAFYFLLRQVSGGSSARRYEILQWLTFLLGFGAQETNVVYPALAAAYTLLCARKHFRRTLPMFAVSFAYLVVHRWAAPPQRTGDYAMHFTSGMLRTLKDYWTWSVGPAYLWTPFRAPAWLAPLGVALVSLGLLAFLVREWRSGSRTAPFFLAWYLIAIAPVLPFRDQRMDYYLYIPVIGLCWLGGQAFAEGWRAAGRYRAAAAALALLYAAMVVPRSVAASDYNHRLAERVRNLVEGVAGAHELHPDQTILLEGVDTDLFYSAILDHPFRALGFENVYLAAGSGRNIAPHPDWGDPAEFILPPDVTAKALDERRLVVYDVRAPRLRNITSEYSARPRSAELPRLVDAGNPLEAYLLGPEWYGIDGDHRWMPKRASLRIGGPRAPGQRLYLRGYCPTGALQEGPLSVTVTVNGAVLEPAAVHPGENSFALSFPLPAPVAGASEMEVVVEVGRTFRLPPDNRDLGLAFGAFEVR